MPFALKEFEDDTPKDVIARNLWVQDQSLYEIEH
jgi:hypothetical protein